MALKVTFRPSFCVFALYLPFYGIYNYILLFPVSLVIIIIIIIIKIKSHTLSYNINSKNYLYIISKNYSVTKNVLKPVSVDSRDRD